MIQSKKKQKNLEYAGWNIYKDSKGEHYKWDTTKKDFVKVEKEDLDKKTQDRNKLVDKGYVEKIINPAQKVEDKGKLIMNEVKEAILLCNRANFGKSMVYVDRVAELIKEFKKEIKQVEDDWKGK